MTDQPDSRLYLLLPPRFDPLEMAAKLASVLAATQRAEADNRVATWSEEKPSELYLSFSKEIQNFLVKKWRE